MTITWKTVALAAAGDAVSQLRDSSERVVDVSRALRASAAVPRGRGGALARISAQVTYAAAADVPAAQAKWAALRAAIDGAGLTAGTLSIVVGTTTHVWANAELTMSDLSCDGCTVTGQFQLLCGAKTT